MKALLTCLTFLSLAIARADVAVIVGINNYAHYNQSLNGAVPDSLQMRSLLERKQFDVSRTLNDNKATKAAIMADLQDVEKTIRYDSVFVFYFAGHGHPNPQELVTYDYSGPSTGISSDDLYAELKRIRQRCKAVNVILDCCFAGYLAKGESVLRSRCLVIPGMKSGGGPDVDDPDTQNFLARQSDDPALNGKPVCYFCAAEANQQALEIEDVKHNEAHGVFTNCLIPTLTQQPVEKWGQIQEAVDNKMDSVLAEASKEAGERFSQHCLVTDEYKPISPFGPLNRTNQRIVPATVSALLDQVAPDPKRLQITTAPAVRNLFVGQPFHLSVSVMGRGGYLIVLSRQETTKVVWPEKNDVQAAYHDPGTIDLIGTGEAALRITGPGEYSIRAYLFDTEAGAKNLIDTFQTGIQSLSETANLKLKNFTDKDSACYTASCDRSALDRLFGDYDIYNAKTLWRYLNDLEYQTIFSDPYFSDGLKPSQIDELLVTSPEEARIELIKHLNTMLGLSKKWVLGKWYKDLKVDQAVKDNIRSLGPDAPSQGAKILSLLFPDAIRPFEPNPMKDK